MNRTLKDVERKDMSNRIGVVMSDSHTKIWEVRFQQLLEYKEIKGNCEVPAKYKLNLRLGPWVARQRCLKGKNTLRKGREAKLESIGFVWDKRNTNWDMRFEQLVEYKRTHGDCGVPFHYELNQELGRWISTQRTLEGKDSLHKDRVAKLESIGFIWDKR
jgi:hypothetical protein